MDWNSFILGSIFGALVGLALAFWVAWPSPKLPTIAFNKFTGKVEVK